MNNEGFLKHFPISFFSMILGLAGTTIAYQRAEKFLHLPFGISDYLIFLTVGLFVLLLVVYATKIIKYPTSVKEEFFHPIKISFFPTLSISFLLLSITFLGISFELARMLWWIGAIGHFVFTITIISIWIQHTKFEIKHMNPAWFIPAVGNLLVPVAGVSFASVEISWFFFSVGIMFWVVLLVILFNRIIFHSPLAERMLPTLFILIAPPAIGFISLVKLTGGITDPAKIMYYLGLFFAILLLAQAKMFLRVKYYLSWWAYSFPLAAITISSTLMYHETKIAFYYAAATFFLVLLSVAVIIISIATIKAISRREICVEE